MCVILWKSISKLFQLQLVVKVVVEHCPKSPHIECNGQLKMGLVKVHYFINDTTTLTSYCLDNYE